MSAPEHPVGNDAEPIAIIGMACRLPGDGDSLEGFWDLISSGRSAHSEIPPTRFNANAWYHPNPDRKGAVITKSGHFLKEDISLFDAPFFSITIKEAETMDPMHRMMLEVAYEGLENAGIPISQIAGTDTGCFVGCFTRDFDQMTGADVYSVAPYAATGGGATMLSNRVSWFYNLKGPSLSVDTACSSGITALHLACQSIKQGDATTCIVGGTNLLIYPELFQALSRMRMISPDGKCHTFDARANGYGRGEGVASLVIKKLSTAIADGDTIRAIIRNTGLNQDGRTPGITMPSAQAQEELIRSTYTRANLSLRETAFFEAHGTGTPVGDPLELSALGATFGASKLPDDQPLYVSSVKTNVGHTEGCSAIAGIIKAVLSLEKGIIAPNADFQTLNPRLRLDSWRLAIPSESMHWPGSGLRRASVNSFGYGGANGHVILDDAYSFLRDHGIQGNHATVLNSTDSLDDHDSGISTPSSSDDGLEVVTPTPKLFVISAFDQAGLERVSQKYLQFLETWPRRAVTTKAKDTDTRVMENLAYTLALRRTQFDYRTFAVGDSLQALQTSLQSKLPSIPRASTQNNIFFVFTGQGAQWPGMGRQLLTDPVFRSSLDESQATLTELGCEWNIARCLENNDTRIHDPEFSQVICTAIQIALVSLLGHWGVTPQAVVGHSSGEIAAAFVAKALSKADAIKTAYFRGLFSQKVPERMNGVPGAMLAAGVSQEEASAYLGQLSSGKAVVACINSPSSVTISGDAAAINELGRVLTQDKKFARKLKVQTAYHSHHMHTISDDYLNALKTIRTQEAPKDAPRMFSSVTGRLIDAEDLNAHYWVQNMVSPVLFGDAVRSLLQFSVKTRGRYKQIEYTAAVEIGPHEALKGPVQQTMANVDAKLTSYVTYTSPLHRGTDSMISALTAAGMLWARGVEVDLAKVNHQMDSQNYRVLGCLPAYPWNHSKGFWHEPEIIRSMRTRPHPRTDLLGSPFDPQNPLAPRWRNFLSISENPWLAQHKIQGSTLYPAAGMLIMVLEAAHQMHQDRGDNRTLHGVEFKHVLFKRGLLVPEGDNSIETNLHINPQKLRNQVSDECFNFTLFSTAPGDSWAEHASGQFSLVYADDETAFLSEQRADWQVKLMELERVKRVASTHVDPKLFYQQLSDVGLAYGDQFKNVTEAFAGKNCAFGTITIPDTKKLMPYGYEFPHLIHPATLDAIFHLSFIATTSGGPLPSASVPVRLESMFISSNLPQGAGSLYKAATTGDMQTMRDRTSSFIISDAEFAQPKIIVRNFSSKDMETTITSANASHGTQSLYNDQFTQLHWIDDPTLETRHISDFEQWLKLKTQKSSSLSALLVDGAALLESVRNFAPRRGSGGRFGRCAVLHRSEQDLVALREDFEADGIISAYHHTSEEDGNFEQVPEDPFDIIISSMDGTSPDNLLIRLQAYQSRLKSGGNIVLLRPDASTQWDDQSLQLSLNAVPDFRVDIKRNWVLVTKPIIVSPRFSQEGIVLLRPSGPASVTTHLLDALTEAARLRGLRVEYAELSDIDKLKGHAIISLLEAEDASILNMDEKQFNALQVLFASVPYILWLGRTTLDHGASTGFLRTIRSEYPQLRLPYLEFDSSAKLDPAHAARSVFTILDATDAREDKPADFEYRDVDGKLLIPRLTTDTHFNAEIEGTKPNPAPSYLPLCSEGQAVEARVLRPGTLESITWVDVEMSQELAADDVAIRVEFVPMHPRDLNTALGKTSLSKLGAEAIGVVVRTGANVSHIPVGSRVAVLKAGACSTVLQQDSRFVQRLPSSVGDNGHTLLPSAYITAYHALHSLARISSGDRVLIHGAGGSTGQAAVQIAKRAGAVVFVTITSEEERNIMQRQYSLPTENIFEYGSSRLVAAVAHRISGGGIDVVFNLGSAKSLQDLLEMISPMGRVINVGIESSDFIMDSNKQLTYSSFSLASMLESQPHLVSQVFEKVYEMIRNNEIGPVHGVRKYPISELPRTLSYLKAGSQYSTIVFEMHHEGRVMRLPSKPKLLELDPTAAYVLCGGLGALGLSLSDDMVESGARHLIFVSRSGATTDLQKAHIKKWEDRGCMISDVKCDTTDMAQVQDLAGRARHNAWNIKGVVQMAMVLRDSPFSTMSYEQWRTGLLPKTLGTWNLHACLPDNLDFFITLSSISNIIGNGGQAQYAAGNAYQDSIAFYRRSLGMAAVSIGLGVMHDLKNNHMSPEDTEKWLARNPTLLPLKFTERDFLTTIKAIMRGATSDLEPVPPYIVCGVKNDLVRDNAARVTHQWVFDAKMELRVKQELELGEQGTSSTGRASLAKKLQDAETTPEALHLVDEAIRETLAAAMSSKPDDIDPRKPLHASGVDSLKAVEFRNWVFAEMKADISVFDILSSKPLASLAAQVVGNSPLVSSQIASRAREVASD